MLKTLTVAILMLAGAICVSAQTKSTPAAKPKTASSAKTQTAPAKTHPATAAKAPAPLTTQKEKFSYALGMNLGNNLHRGDVAVDPDILARGLKDAIAGGKMQMTEPEAAAVLEQVSNEARQKMQAKMQQEAEANKKAGDAFLASNKAKEGVVALPDGLQYKILTAGTGPKPAASDTVVCNYRGTLTDGTEFDSSYKRNEPLTIPVSGVIKGWTEALQLMPVGSKWQLFIPADLAYGEHGQGPIPANSTLVFEVELLSIKPKEAEQTPGKAPESAPENPSSTAPAASAPGSAASSSAPEKTPAAGDQK